SSCSTRAVRRCTAGVPRGPLRDSCSHRWTWRPVQAASSWSRSPSGAQGKSFLSTRPGARSPTVCASPTSLSRAAAEAWLLGARLSSPNAVAFARDGSVWVVDRNNKLLRHLSADGRFLGAVGAPDGAGPASLTEPRDLGLDSGGQVIVADAGANRIYKLAPD